MRSLAALLVLSSFSTFAACPNLSGKYPLCRSTQGMTSNTLDNELTQKTRSGVTTYTLSGTDEESQERTSKDYLADGKTYTTTETNANGEEIVTMITNTCTGNSLINIESVSLQGEKASEIKTEMKKSGGKLKMLLHAVVFGTEYKDVLECE